jgi:hypothetical protein
MISTKKISLSGSSHLIKRYIFIILVVPIVGIAIFLTAYHQPYYPRTWLDEGFVLQGAINLAIHGQYALLSSEGFRAFDQPLIANGPGIILPISAAFSVFGIGLMQARAVMVVFSLITLSIFYILGKQMYGAKAALISIFFLIALPSEGFLLYGRHALGMIPSFGYFLIGYLIFIKSLDSNSKLYASLGGILLGLAAITKGQYLILIPIFGTVALVELIYYKTKSFTKILVLLISILVPIAIWYLAQFLYFGYEGFIENLNAISSSSKVTITTFRTTRIPGNLWYLVRSGILLVIGPGFLYIAWLSRTRNLSSLYHVPLLVFVVGWLFWFAFLSVGFHRYSLDPYMVGSLFTGKLLIDITQHFKADAFVKGLGKSLTSKYYRLGIVYVMGILLAGTFGFTGQVKRVMASPDLAPQRFAEYLQENIPPGSVIESVEWEIDHLAYDLTYHHPTNDWIDKMHEVTQFGIDIDEIYDPSEFNPDYLIDGPISSWTGIYSEYFASGCCSLITRVGNYNLYQVVR